MSDETILISKKTAAASLGIGVRMLEKLVRRGEITPVRIGDRVLFLRETLEEFARARCVRRTAGEVMICLN
jgi:excisionase family DNA binding protein